MDGHMQTDFMKYLQSEVEKYRGVMVPVKASFAERMAVKMVPAKNIHPNPDDEFCDPLIGPNYGIISRYERIFREERTMRPSSHDERLTVEKVHPDGYMLLNGHHRWAAGLRVGFKWMPVSIVNLTQETDIEKMLQASTHDRRVTLDLDEVIFCKDGMPAEKPLPFPYRSLYREPIRLGVPALLHFLSMRGYDIWVYTAELYSLEYIREYFRRYSAKVDERPAAERMRRKESGSCSRHGTGKRCTLTVIRSCGPSGMAGISRNMPYRMTPPAGRSR